MKKTFFKPLKALLIAVIFVFVSCEKYDAKGDSSNIINLPPMKDQFSSYFDIGNIFNPNDVGSRVTNPWLTRHYNVLTAENHMKPNQLMPSRNGTNFTTADRMVNAALASGFKVVGHTLLWHSQIPQWQRALGTDSTSPEEALRYMREYIDRVVRHFAGRVYKWDVLNEVFPDGLNNANANWRTVMRQENPWNRKIGADFVREGFIAARLADPNAILYYNDYNMDQLHKRTMVHNMVRDINNDWVNDDRNPQKGNSNGRKLIEGIGLQGHHNTGVSVASVRASIDLFRPLGVRLSISELDVLAQTYRQFADNPAGYGPNKHGQTTVTSQGLETQTRLYGEYFAVFLENADIIERVTFWGVSDDQSWRSSALPLIFDQSGRAKDAYFKIIEALGRR
jgi:endo-1,4-beta-xylanase